MKQKSGITTRSENLFKGERIFIASMFAVLGIYTAFVVFILGGVFFYTDMASIQKTLFAPETLFAIKLSLVTSLITTFLAILVAIPAGYCLSRYEFRGKAIIDTLIDLPIVLPPLVVGMCLLIFFALPLGAFIENNTTRFIFAVPGIILAQFSISASFAIIAVRAAFDNVDPRYEDAARMLGCSKIQAFTHITLPLVKTGIVSGAVMTWTRAVGEYVPVLLIAGATRGKTTTMPVAIFLEFEVGNIEGTVGLTIIFLLLSAIYLAIFKNLGFRVGRNLARGQN